VDESILRGATVLLLDDDVIVNLGTTGTLEEMGRQGPQLRAP